MKRLVGGRDCEDRAPGVREAVATHLTTPEPGQRAASARPDYEQVIGTFGGADEDPPRRAAYYYRHNHQARRDAAPRRMHGLIEPLSGSALPDET